MEKIVVKVEHYISYALITVGLSYAAYQTVELVYMFVTKLFQSISTMQFLEERAGRPVAGIFFNVLLTLELIATIRVFDKSQFVKVRVIMVVGLIAVTRKILEMEHIESAQGLMVAALIVALSVGYFLVSRAPQGTEEPKK